MIKITNTDDTRILKVTVTSPDPQESADIANELIDQACIYLPQIMETEEPNLVEEAIPPTAKSSPSTAKNVMLGRPAGGLSGLRRAGGALPNERHLCHPPTMWSSTWASSRWLSSRRQTSGNSTARSRKSCLGGKGRNERT